MSTTEPREITPDMSDDELLAEERRKYGKMWAQRSYRTNSPGLAVLSRSLQLLKPHNGASFIDYGCGPALVVDRLEQRGHPTLGVDLIDHRPETIVAPLWDLPPELGSDYAVCFDVMEHMPPHKVGEVLDALAEKTTVGIAFSIAHMEAKGGLRVGEVLHLTIEDRAWWEAQLVERWQTVTMHPTAQKWRSLWICLA